MLAIGKTVINCIVFVLIAGLSLNVLAAQGTDAKFPEGNSDGNFEMPAASNPRSLSDPGKKQKPHPTSTINIAPPDTLVVQQSALQEYLRHMLSFHPRLMEAEADSRASGLRIKEAKSALLPRLSVSGNAGHEVQDAESFERRYNQRLGQARVVVPLIDVGLTAQIKARQASSVVADWSLTNVREDLILQGALSYQELQRHDKLVALARDNLTIHRQYVAQVKEIARSDIGRAADLSAAVSRVALAESVLTSRLARLEGARVRWLQLTGLAAPDEPAPFAPPPGPGSIEMAINQALESHPQIHQARAAIDVARQNVVVARSSFAPKLNAELGRKNGSDWGGVKGSQATRYAGVSLEWTVFAGFSERYATQAADESVVSAQHASEHLQNELRARVAQTWYDLVSAEKSLESFLVYEANTEEVVEAYRSQFRIGRRSLLDVLNAENELFTARSNIVFATHDISAAEWQLSGLRGQLAPALGL